MSLATKCAHCGVYRPLGRRCPKCGTPAPGPYARLALALVVLALGCETEAGLTRRAVATCPSTCAAAGMAFAAYSTSGGCICVPDAGSPR